MFSSITTAKNNLFKNFKNYFKKMNHKKTIITASIVILIFLTVLIIFTIFKIKTQVKDLFRMNAMRLFLNDYEKGLKENRYIHVELPCLPFSDNQFKLSLSSHFLFLYSDNLSFEFHLDAIKEMLRVSKEARIFPILNVNADESPYISDIRIQLDNSGFFF